MPGIREGHMTHTNPSGDMRQDLTGIYAAKMRRSRILGSMNFSTRRPARGISCQEAAGSLHQATWHMTAWMSAAGHMMTTTRHSGSRERYPT